MYTRKYSGGSRTSSRRSSVRVLNKKTGKRRQLKTNVKRPTYVTTTGHTRRKSFAGSRRRNRSRTAKSKRATGGKTGIGLSCFGRKKPNIPYHKKEFAKKFCSARINLEQHFLGLTHQDWVNKGGKPYGILNNELSDYADKIELDDDNENNWAKIIDDFDATVGKDILDAVRKSKASKDTTFKLINWLNNDSIEKCYKESQLFEIARSR